MCMGPAVVDGAVEFVGLLKAITDQNPGEIFRPQSGAFFFFFFVHAYLFFLNFLFAFVVFVVGWSMFVFGLFHLSRVVDIYFSFVDRAVREFCDRSAAFLFVDMWKGVQLSERARWASRARACVACSLDFRKSCSLRGIFRR